MFLSQIELAPDATCRPEFWREVSTPQGAHRALWKLFARSPEQRRNFLFRHDDRGARGAGRVRFHVLSTEPPGADGLWRIDTRAFTPTLRPGDRLRFLLRASPTVKKAAPGRRQGRRHDVVMNAKKSGGDDGGDLSRLLAVEGEKWLVRQATRAGFALEPGEDAALGEDGLLEEPSRAALRVEGYRQHRIPRRSGAPIEFSTVDFEGLLSVREPSLFLQSVAGGFGAQKAFGCGLMLLRRA